jgi:hypothetical protein
MRNYIEKKMKDAKPIATEPPPIQQEQEQEREQVTEEPTKVNHK